MMRIQGTETNNDPYYRYMMPIPDIKIEKGSVIITNIDKVCESLNRESSIIASYIGYRLGCQSKCKKGTLYIKTKSSKDILSIIVDFIEKLIICKECRNPETIIHNSGKKFYLKCDACGTSTGDNIIDLTDKYISRLSIFKVNKKQKKCKKKKKSKFKPDD